MSRSLSSLKTWSRGGERGFSPTTNDEPFTGVSFTSTKGRVILIGSHSLLARHVVRGGGIRIYRGAGRQA